MELTYLIKALLKHGRGNLGKKLLLCWHFYRNIKINRDKQMALCFRMMKAWKMVVGMFHLCLINNMYPLCSLGKLEEEFEKKFNSLPQYSPLTFDKKSTTITKKKKTDVSSAPEEQPPKPAKGKQRMLPECSPNISICFDRSHPSASHTAPVAPRFQELYHIVTI